MLLRHLVHKGQTILKTLKKIFLVGAKPNPNFPNFDPEIIYAANSAIFHTKKYGENVKKIGIISNSYITKTKDFIKRKEISSGVHLDQLIVINFRGKAEEASIDEMGITADEVVRISIRKKLILECAAIGLLNTAHMFLSDLTHKDFLLLLKRLLKKGLFLSLKTSTGLFTLAVANHQNKLSESKTFLIGISIKDDFSGHFYNHDVPHYGHEESDEKFIRCILKKYRQNIVITDSDANKFISKRVV